MSDEQPPPGQTGLIPEYQHQPPAVPYPGRRPLAISEIVSWAIVVVLVAITAITVAIQQRRERGLPADPAQITLSAKYAVGVHALLPVAGTSSQLLTEVDGEAKTPEDRFRAALLSGEIAGKEEALRRLDALDAGSPGLWGDIATARAFYGDQPPIESQNLAAFRTKWDWFATVAESFGKPAADPAREQMLGAAYRTVVGMGVFAVGGLGMGLVGLALLITALVRVSTRRLVPAYGSLRTGAPALPLDRRAYIQGFALFVGLLFGTQMLLEALPKSIALITLLAAGVTLVIMPTSVLLGLFWPRIMGGTWAQWRAAFGLTLGRGIFREMFAGVLGYLAGLPLLAAGFMVTLLLLKIADVRPTHPIEGPLEHGGILIIGLVFLLASVWAPITEELMFRGALFSHLRERFGPLASGITVGFIFALVHPQGWPLVPVLGTVGFILAMIREWRGSIIGCMTAHALHNTLTLAFMLTITR